MLLKKKKQNAKWEENKTLYKGRYTLVRQLFQLSIFVSVLSVLVVLYLFFQNSQNFKLEFVEVSGNIQRLTPDQIIVLSELQKNEHLFSVDFQKVRDHILRHPWVKTVKLRRKVPDAIQIDVTERTVKALLFLEKLYLVDEDGKIFKSHENENIEDLPVVTGFQKDDIEKYPLLSQQYLDRCFENLLYLQQQHVYTQDPISEINCDSVFGVTVFTRDRGLEIYYGKDELAEKHAKLKKFMSTSHFETTAFVRLDLDSPGKVIARKF